MKRRTFDLLVSIAGLFLAVTLAIAGGLALWGHNFIDHEVHNQLAAEKIFFPASNSPAIKAPEFAAMHQYAGQQLTTGAQAEVWADHFIANHLKVIGGGKTYAQLSAEAIAKPDRRQTGRPGRHRLQGRDTARTAAQRLRLRHHGHHRRHRRHRRVHRRPGHADPRRPRPDARPACVPDTTDSAQAVRRIARSRRRPSAGRSSQPQWPRCHSAR